VKAGIEEIECRLVAPPGKLSMYLNKGEVDPTPELYDFVATGGQIVIKTNGKADNYTLAVARLPGSKADPVDYSLLVSSDDSSLYLPIGNSLFLTLRGNHSEEFVLMVHPRQE
jgi:hypothetical protein